MADTLSCDCYSCLCIHVFFFETTTRFWWNMSNIYPRSIDVIRDELV